MVRALFARSTLLALAGASIACSGGGDAGVDDGASDPAPGAPPPSAAASGEPASEPGATGTPAPDAGGAHDAGAHDAAAPADAAPLDAGPKCKKELTVVFSVGTGAGAVGAHTNGCWTVVDADGAANHAFRKCSTSNFVVQNAGAANYAYDDTNPTRPLSDDQSFLAKCSSGATGTGFEYMAYRGSWRLITAPRIDAYFAELYSSDQTISDSYASWQTTIAGHTVSPMINIGPNDPATIESSALKMCNRVSSHGYFGVYNSAWQDGMTATDARAVGIAKALNTCTGG